jgi:hypothetical protein
MSPIKCEKEITGRCLIKAGESYVIVCSAEKRGKVGEFYLSVYFDLKLREMEIKRVFHEKDKRKAIEECLP